MRKLLSLLLVGALMLQFFLQIGVITYFKINQSQIAIELCINKDKPASCCQGKCYLGKQLADIETEHHKDKQVNNIEVPNFFLPDNAVEWINSSLSIKLKSKEILLACSDYKSESEQPPEPLV